MDHVSTDAALCFSVVGLLHWPAGFAHTSAWQCSQRNSKALKLVALSVPNPFLPSAPAALTAASCSSWP